MPSNRRSYGLNEIIYIPEGVEQWVINGVEFAGVSTSAIKTGDDALIVDGSATSTLTKSFDNCTQIRPKVVVIHTAGPGWRFIDLHYSRLSKDIFCPGSNWYDRCESIHCSCIKTRFIFSQRTEQIRISCNS